MKEARQTQAERLYTLLGDLPPSLLADAFPEGDGSAITSPKSKHIRRIGRAILAYAACIALLVGAILYMPKLIQSIGSSDTAKTTTAVTTAVTTTVTTIDRDVVYNPNAELTDQQIQLYEAIWAAIQNDVAEEWTINDISVGSFVVQCDEAFVCFFYGCPENGQADALSEETVEGYQFRYTTLTPLGVFANGHSYSLRSAYSAGVLTKEELRTIWEAYKAKYPGRYESDEWN